jgi:hypothetical protein
MRRYIVLLLITGIVWAQTDFDKLVLKSGTTYLGEYSKIEGEIVYFKPQNAFAFQPISIKLIQTLQLKDGQFIIGDGKDILTYEEYQKESLEENQKKITVEEKAIVVLKTVSGKKYKGKGKYLKSEGGKVFFIPEGASSSTQVPIESIKEIITETGEKISLLSTLIMKDGTVIKGSLTMISIDSIRFLKENETTLVDIQKDDIKSLTGIDGEIDLNNIDVKSPPDFDTLNRLTLEEYQKLSTKEKAIYDAKSKNLGKWVLYGSIIPIITSVYNEVIYWTGGPRISIAFSAAITTIPSYFVLNHQEKFNFPKSIITDSEKEIYEQAYSKELQKRKFIHFLGCSIVDVALSLMSGSSRRSFNMSGGGGGKGFTGFGP